MTDDQLRAMARRVLEITNQPSYGADGMRYVPLFIEGVSVTAALNRAVAILREEMGKHRCVHQLAKEFADSCGLDDPTQTIVIDV